MNYIKDFRGFLNEATVANQSGLNIETSTGTGGAFVSFKMPLKEIPSQQKPLTIVKGNYPNYTVQQADTTGFNTNSKFEFRINCKILGAQVLSDAHNLFKYALKPSDFCKIENTPTGTKITMLSPEETKNNIFKSAQEASEEAKAKLFPNIQTLDDMPEHELFIILKYPLKELEGAVIVK